MAETGWFDQENIEKNRNIIDEYFTSGRTLVSVVEGSAESLAVSMPGTFRYVHEDIDLCAITLVATSRVARKQGHASNLIVESLAAAAEQGALIAGLGVFEQGFYERFGFGVGPYEHYVSFNPESLKIQKKLRPPQRLAVQDYKAVHASRLSRMKGHGSCSLIPDISSRLEMLYITGGFGLGYYNESNKLTHHIWMRIKGEQGPAEVWWMSYQTYDQFLELMALIQSLSDQVFSVEMNEPPGIQFQDLLQKPFTHRETTKQSRFANYMEASAYWQLRILNLPGCMAKTHLQGKPVSFNLELHDPVMRFIDPDSHWQGVEGRFVVRLGKTCSAEAGHRKDLPTLNASVGAFTRLWLGVGSARGLSATDMLDGPEELLLALEHAILLPTPKTDWDF
jgi:predicted acetyltransferase